MNWRDVLWFSFLCLAGNVLYQAMNDHRWIVAVERTWFQGNALLVAWLLLKVRRYLKEAK